MSRREQLIALLADGAIHPGPELAQTLGCSRAAIWKHLQHLGELGLKVEALPARGYRLSRPLELLDADRIRAGLSADVRQRLESLVVAGSVDSTSERLRQSPPSAPGHSRVMLAEFQTGGRGRRGRRWLSPFASGICLSVSWTFELPPPDLPALGLAAGVAVHEVLAGLCRDAGLKWPNDVVTPRGKLAGLLVDLSGEVGGPLQAVIGVGVNLRVNESLSHAVAETGGLPPAGIELPDGDVQWSRNLLAAGLVDAVIRAMVLFARDGLTPFADAWRRADVLQGAQVEVISGTSHRLGIARGISSDGALLLEVNGQLVTVLSGDVSVRKAP